MEFSALSGLCLAYFSAGCFRFFRHFLFVVWLCQLLYLGWHSYVLKRPPVATIQETLFFVSWVVASLFFLLKRYAEWFPLIGAFSSAFFLAFAMIASSPRVPLAPVLNAPYWLLVHVLVIVASYGFFFVSAVASHFYLMNRKQHWYQIVFPCHFIGVGLLTLGTILGGLWASRTWGSFWSWDVKESWALITICIYLLVLHLESFQLASQQTICLISSVGFLAVTFTWYGINFVLKKGMHTYGFGDGGVFFYYLFLIVDALFLGYSLMRRISK